MRQVYFDPFGKYAEGYDKGAQRQLQTEKDVREARLADYNLQNNSPLETSILKDRADVSHFNIPAVEQQEQQLARFGYLRNQNMLASGAQSYAQMTGDTDPYIDATNQMYRRNLSPEIVNGTPTGNYIYNMMGPDGKPLLDATGNPVPHKILSMQDLQQSLDREHARQAGLTDAQIDMLHGKAFNSTTANQTKEDIAAGNQGARVEAAQVAHPGAKQPISNPYTTGSGGGPAGFPRLIPSAPQQQQMGAPQQTGMGYPAQSRLPAPYGAAMGDYGAPRQNDMSGQYSGGQ